MATAGSLGFPSIEVSIGLAWSTCNHTKDPSVTMPPRQQGQALHRTSGWASEAPWYDGYAAYLFGGPVTWNPASGARDTLSYPILSYPILSYPILSSPILSYPILSYPILSRTRPARRLPIPHTPGTPHSLVRLAPRPPPWAT